MVAAAHASQPTFNVATLCARGQRTEDRGVAAAAALGFPTMPAKRSKSYKLRSTLRMATFANTGSRWLRMRAGPTKVYDRRNDCLTLDG